MKKFDYETALDLLRIDAYERKTKSWVLVKLVDQPPSNRNDFFLLQDMISSSSSSRTQIYRKNFLIGKVLEKLKRDYSLVQSILDKYRGKLVVAGGAVFRSFRNILEKTDLDFFFINCTKEEIMNILKDIRNSFFPKKIGCLRNLRTTTFIIEDRNMGEMGMDNLGENETDFGTKYQFIHSRSYPNVASVIGGFDITIAACLYDGESFYTTTLGEISLKYCFNIVDPSRRSTTYEQRLRKYSRYCSIIFPFLTRSHLIKMGIENGMETSGKNVKVEVLKGLELWVCVYGTRV